MPNLPLMTKDRPDSGLITVKNGGSSTIPRGCPVVLDMDGTDDGVAVVAPSGAAAGDATSFFIGIAKKDIPAGEWGDAVCFGWCNYATVVRQTRAASTDSYASAPALAVGDQLNLQSVGDGLTRSGAGNVSAALPFAVALESAASVASAASTTSDSSTRVTTGMKVWIRAL